MSRLPVLIAVMTVVATPAIAQESIRPGQTVRGELTTSDPRLDDGSHYDCFSVQTRRGQSLQIDQTSEAFDSYLTVGTGSCANPTDPASDDDGGGGLNSRLVRAGDGGLLAIRVNSLEGGATGAYQLRVMEASGATPARARAGTSVAVGQTARGELTASDPTLSDGSHYDCFEVQTRRGQTLQIDQSSNDFDSYLTVGSGTCGSVSGSSDDDGGDGLNSRLRHEGDGNMLIIRANSVGRGETGRYELAVTEVGEIRPAPARPSGSPPATLAQASCQRLAEAAVAFHDFRAGMQDLATAMGQTGNPEIARLQPRIDRMKAWGEARGYRPHEATAQDGILYESTTADMLTEFERRCRN